MQRVTLSMVQALLVDAPPLVQLLHLTAASSQYDGQRQSLRAAIT